MMSPPKFTRKQIEELATETAWLRGVDFFRSGFVRRVWVQDCCRYEADVSGLHDERVTIQKALSGKIQVSCTCLYDWGGICKHAVAVMLYILRGPTPRYALRQSRLGQDTELKQMLERLTGDQLRLFLHQTIVENPSLKRDLEIFARGSEETSLTMQDYRDELERDLENYVQDFSDPDASEADRSDETLNVLAEPYFEQAQKYRNQGNILEALKIYQALFEQFGGLTEKFDGYPILEDEVYFYAQRAIEHWSDCLSEAGLNWDDKEEYLEYALDLLIKRPYGLHAYESVVLAAVSSQRDAQYFLNAFENANLSSARKLEIAGAWLQLLSYTGDSARFLELGGQVVAERPELAGPLMEKRLELGEVELARRIGEAALRKLPPNEQKEVRELMADVYHAQGDRSRAAENLRSLLFLEYESKSYTRLKELLETPEERQRLWNEMIERLPLDLLVKIFREEGAWEMLLKLARRHAGDPDLIALLQSLRDRYPDETFQLYRKKIEENLNRARTFKQSRLALSLLRDMRQVPNHAEDFDKFLQSLRESCKNKPSLMETLNHI